MVDIEFKIKKLDPKAVIPTYAHDGDVCLDLTAISVEYDKEKDMYKYHTGLSIETERNYGILLFPRSSNNRTDAYLCNHVGVVESCNYRGEIILCFKNRDSIVSRATQEGIREFMASYNPTPRIIVNEQYNGVNLSVGADRSCLDMFWGLLTVNTYSNKI